ncbi:MAG: hypothetical protein M1381_04710 [Deltaproteobacteria bacterium]|nr:hypothetical protein [Deltaproteobacteria bacterium]MCL5791907.1 hypothetical protein [Deltaproteobacteria bacterium]
MTDQLFSIENLYSFLQDREQGMFQEIEEMQADRLLNTKVDDLYDYFEQRYKIDIPSLKENEIATDQEEANVDISRDPYRRIVAPGSPFYIKGTALKFFVPFEGDPELLKYKPSTFTYNSPLCTIKQNEIVFTYTRTDHNAEAVKAEFTRHLSVVRQNLKSVINDAGAFNNSIRTKAQNRIEIRRQKLLNDQGLAASLGFPLRRRDNAPQTFAVPTVRKKIQIPVPSSSTPLAPEPTLDMKEYENILSIISNMVKVIERSPNSFKTIREEDLRQHFLVQLNGQYEGQATGETFNSQGKTDILIRHEDKNIFIAECKFWYGQESLTKAIDQLLGYITWRDTKTALLIFNRNKNFSSVLSKIPEVIKAHPNYKEALSYSSASGFRYILHHKDDKYRDIILTILAFEVPA